MSQRQSQPLPLVPHNDQNPNFLVACRHRKFGSLEVTFWTKEAFNLNTGFYPVSPKTKGAFTKNPIFAKGVSIFFQKEYRYD
jgi:hypothetical protein